MPTRLVHIVIDAAEPGQLARFWAAALCWEITTEEHQEAAEVTRPRDLGAERADIGQGDVPWVVLADPEGNEFCVPSAELWVHHDVHGCKDIDCVRDLGLIESAAARPQT